jgi:RNA polymerase sigma-70 factor (ECF subfamily)
VDDAEIIAASIGDPGAFGEIFERHHDAIARYAMRRVGHSAGEDVAARTFVIAFTRRDRFDTSARSARPWLYGIATNLIRHHVRDERSHLIARAKIPAQLVEPDPNEDVSRLDAQRVAGEIRDGLIALNRADREALMLHVLGELSYEEVAAALAIPVGTVKSRLHRARGQLRERFMSVGAIRDLMSGSTLESDLDG